MLCISSHCCQSDDWLWTLSFFFLHFHILLLLLSLLLSLSFSDPPPFFFFLSFFFLLFPSFSIFSPFRTFFPSCFFPFLFFFFKKINQRFSEKSVRLHKCLAARRASALRVKAVARRQQPAAPPGTALPHQQRARVEFLREQLAALERLFTVTGWWFFWRCGLADLTLYLPSRQGAPRPAATVRGSQVRGLKKRRRRRRRRKRRRRRRRWWWVVADDGEGRRKRTRIKCKQPKQSDDGGNLHVQPACDDNAHVVRHGMRQIPYRRLLQLIPAGTFLRNNILKGTIIFLFLFFIFYFILSFFLYSFLLSFFLAHRFVSLQTEGDSGSEAAYHRSRSRRARARAAGRAPEH